MIDRDFIFDAHNSDYKREFINYGSIFVNNMKTLDIRVELLNYGTLELAGELTTRSGW